MWAKSLTLVVALSFAGTSQASHSAPDPNLGQKEAHVIKDASSTARSSSGEPPQRSSLCGGKSQTSEAKGPATAASVPLCYGGKKSVQTKAAQPR